MNYCECGCETPIDFPLDHLCRVPTCVNPPETVSVTAALLLKAHEDSGFTWDQLARYFGVSRRAVHLWAAGGRMSATNEELLTQLVAAIEGVLHLDSAARRQALLRTEAGLNTIDAARAERSSRPTDINRSPDTHEGRCAVNDLRGRVAALLRQHQVFVDTAVSFPVGRPADLPLRWWRCACGANPGRATGDTDHGITHLVEQIMTVLDVGRE